MSVERIISGGQTGADRGGLDAVVPDANGYWGCDHCDRAALDGET